ncbi:MAG: glycosyltransferase family 39 protein [Elusimicrobia bacterium]|nr:glycosyltransferase family 39 protein [Elusimicrobiota bacterium]
MAAIISLAVSLRLAAAASMYVAAVWLGRDGFITGDDKGYADLAWGVAQYWRGAPDPTYLPPTWNGAAYFLGLFTYYESAIFYVFGRQVLMAEFINAGFAAAMLLLVFDLARRLFGARAGAAALVAAAFFPSLVLWSALNLKDALVLLLVATAFWLIHRFQVTRSWRVLAAIFVLLVPIHELRSYVFFAIAGAVPPAVAVMAKARLRERAAWTAVSTVLTAALMINYGLLNWLPVSLVGFEAIRQAMASGARTSFVESPPAVVRPGDAFVVTGASSSTGRGIAAPPGAASGAPSAATGAPPGAAPEIVRVGTDTRVVLAASSASSATTGVTHVRAGDIVIVGAPGTTPTRTTPAPVQVTEQRQALQGVMRPGDVFIVVTASPSPSASPAAPGQGQVTVTAPPAAAQGPARQIVRVRADTHLVLVAASGSESSTPGVTYVRPGDIVVVVDEAEATESRGTPTPLQLTDVRGEPSVTLINWSDRQTGVAQRTLAHVPTGIMHVLFAPFPWEIDRRSDLPVAIDMLLWYAVLLFGAWTLWRARGAWRSFLPMLLYVAALLGLFVFIQGNLGILFRHRSMVFPFAVALAGPGIAALATRMGTLLRRPAEVSASGPTTPARGGP